MLPVTLVAAFLLTGCANAQPVKTAKAAPVAYTVPACRPVLGELAGPPPANASASGSEINALQGLAPSGTTLAVLVNQVRGDLLKLSFVQSGLAGNASAALADYDSDTRQIRQYCG